MAACLNLIQSEWVNYLGFDLRTPNPKDFQSIGNAGIVLEYPNKSFRVGKDKVIFGNIGFGTIR